MTFVKSPPAFYLDSADLSNSIKAVWRVCVDHTQLWAVTVCKLSLQTKVAKMPTNTWPMIIKNIADPQVFGLSQREVSGITVSQGAN